MRIRTLSLALLALAAATVPWLVCARQDGAGEYAPSAPSATVAPAEPAATTADHAPAPDHGRREVIHAPAARVARKVLLTGRVVDQAGQPVRKAMVCLDRGRPDFGGLEETGAAGTYEYTVAPGDHELLAKCNGTALARATIQVPEGVERFEAPPLVLPEGMVIRGRVLGAREEPMADILVKAFAERGEDRWIRSAGKLLLLQSEDVLTAADGSFELRGVEDLPYSVAVHPQHEHPHLRSEPREMAGVVPDGRLLEFRLVPEDLVRGIVLDARTGRPIPRFSVMQTEVRSADGRFAVPLRRHYEFEVEANGYLSASREDAAVVAQGEDLVVRLAPDPDRATLTVVAKDEAGAPVRSFRVNWMRGKRSHHDEARASGGSLRITVPGSKTQFWVEAEGRAFACFVAELGREGERTIEVRLTRAAPVRLQLVFPDGDRAEFVSATIEDEQGAGQPWRFTFTTPRRNRPVPEWLVFGSGELMPVIGGRGLIGGLRPGRYRLTLWRDDAPATPFTVSADRIEELIVELK